MRGNVQQQINVIVDTGCANLFSVKFAIERLGFDVIISDDINVIKQADKVILPGVGSAKYAMANIIEKGLVKTLQNLKQPVLGFCLGMQLMTESSTEVTPLEAQDNRLPHMGWNTLTTLVEHPVFNGIALGDYFYFVHSFAAPISEYTLATCQYGSNFSAVIAKDNFIGCQFHPERSGELGSKIIQNFLELEHS
jgi:glutamine amidotransferase